VSSLYPRPIVPPSFTTVRIGEQSVSVPELPEPLRFLVVLIRSNDTGGFRVLGSSTEVATAEEALAGVETTGPIAWRPSTAPLADEQACFLCGCSIGKPLEARQRHPERLCAVCTLEVTDANGRPLAFGNVDLGGGFRSWYPDTGENYGRHECFVRGRECLAAEARFGGIVIVPRQAR
jgi:hypothetical protein